MLQAWRVSSLREIGQLRGYFWRRRDGNENEDDDDNDNGTTAPDRRTLGGTASRKRIARWRKRNYRQREVASAGSCRPIESCHRFSFARFLSVLVTDVSPKHGILSILRSISFMNAHSTLFYIVLHFLGCKISIKFSLELTRIDSSSRKVLVKIFNIAEQALIAAKVIRITQIFTKAQLITLIIMFRANSSINQKLLISN